MFFVSLFCNTFCCPFVGVSQPVLQFHRVATCMFYNKVLCIGVRVCLVVFVCVSSIFGDIVYIYV